MKTLLQKNNWLQASSCCYQGVVTHLKTGSFIGAANIPTHAYDTAMQNKNAVAAYFTSQQLLPFRFKRQNKALYGWVSLTQAHYFCLESRSAFCVYA